MPRLFTGVEIPDDIADEISLMRGGLPGATWIDRDSYHITLRFFGDIDAGLARELHLLLGQVMQRPFTLRLKGIGMFGGNKPHSLHITLALSEELLRLQAAHERLSRAAGLEPEGRKFIPHITLARLSQTPAASLMSYLAAHNLYASRPFDVRRFVLYSSRPSRGGGPYAIEGSYLLAGTG
jgi:RNA 2',3'-cyclic 3'-phosphodiesterase